MLRRSGLFVVALCAAIAMFFGSPAGATPLQASIPHDPVTVGSDTEASPISTPGLVEFCVNAALVYGSCWGTLATLTLITVTDGISRDTSADIQPISWVPTTVETVIFTVDMLAAILNISGQAEDQGKL